MQTEQGNHIHIKYDIELVKNCVNNINCNCCKCFDFRISIILRISISFNYFLISVLIFTEYHHRVFSFFLHLFRQINAEHIVYLYDEAYRCET